MVDSRLRGNDEAGGANNQDSGWCGRRAPGAIHSDTRNPCPCQGRGDGGEADTSLDATGELLASDEQVAAVTRDDIVPDMHSVGTLVVGVLPPGVVVGEVAKL